MMLKQHLLVPRSTVHKNPDRNFESDVIRTPRRLGGKHELSYIPSIDSLVATSIAPQHYFSRPTAIRDSKIGMTRKKIGRKMGIEPGLFRSTDQCAFTRATVVLKPNIITETTRDLTSLTRFKNFPSCKFYSCNKDCE